MSTIAASQLAVSVAIRSLGKAETPRTDPSLRVHPGFRLSTAVDDAVKMDFGDLVQSNVRSFGMAMRSVNDVVTSVQNAGKSVDEILGNITQMRELALRAQSSQTSSAERSSLQKEFSKLREQIDAKALDRHPAGKNIFELLDSMPRMLTTTLAVYDKSDAKRELASRLKLNPSTYSASINPEGHFSFKGEENWQRLDIADPSLSAASLRTTIMSGLSTRGPGTSYRLPGEDLQAQTTNLQYQLESARKATTQSQTFVSIGEQESRDVLGWAARSEEPAFSYRESKPLLSRNLGSDALSLSAINLTDTTRPASEVLNALDSALVTAGTERSRLQAMENAIQYRYEFFASSARKDLAINDMQHASELARLTESQIQLASGVSLITQAHITPAMALALLG